MQRYQTVEISTLHEIDFPPSEPTTLQNAFDQATRKQAATWLTWDNEIFGDYEGSKDKFHHVVQPCTGVEE